MRVIHADLKTAQEALVSTPYIKLVIPTGGTDYSSRLIALEHIEEPMRDEAVIYLRNNDRALDPGTTGSATDLRGKGFYIGYGYVAAGSVNRYLGDGLDAGKNPAMPNLWVKEQFITSQEGESVCVLVCEGMWAKLREIQVLLSGVNTVLTLSSTGYTSCVAGDIGKQIKDDGVEVGLLSSYDNNTRKWYLTSATVIATASAITITTGTGAGTADGASILRTPYYQYAFGGTQTIKAIIALALAEASMTLNATIPDDGIIDTLKPFFLFDIESMPSLASLIYDNDMLQASKCFLRPEASNVFKLIYPQTTDAVDETYYSGQIPFFKEYKEKLNLLIPNSITVYWGANVVSGQWDDATSQANLANPGTATDADSIAAYTTISRTYFAPFLTSQANANLRAAAILGRFKSETLAGKLILPYHDCSVELYDKVEIDDQRGH